MQRLFLLLFLVAGFSLSAQVKDIKSVIITGEYNLPNRIAPLDYDDDRIYRTDASKYLPVQDISFIEHVRVKATGDEQKEVSTRFEANLNHLRKCKYAKHLEGEITAVAEKNGVLWIGTEEGLYKVDEESGNVDKQLAYGLNGPLSTNITSLAFDSKGSLWIGTPIGITVLSRNGEWRAVRGEQGLPVEEVTAISIDTNDNIWIGTTQGAILHTPYKDGRKWYYRAGKRFLINDTILDVFVESDGLPVYFKTNEGISKLDGVDMTLAKRAEMIESRIDRWHRREGVVASCTLDDAENPTDRFIKDDDNDGLWTSYHVMAMSLAYATTGEEKYLESARKSMHAMIMLQNISGIPGLPARSVVPVSMRDEKNAQWRDAPDGKHLWKSDTSSDEIDGHFFAFYAYWEHIAKNNTQEAALIKKQVTELMDYIVDNNYQLIDWDGERTRWGFWNPELLNDDPEHYTEAGLNSAQILSFLKTTYYITGDEKYKKHYDNLIVEHGYLGNVMLEKKVFPDLNNHSDNQLGFVALYPLFQLEFDPKARNVLQRVARRHYRVVGMDGSAFFYFAAATIDPDFVNIQGGVENLRQIQTDRRQWKMVNSNRKDIVWNPYKTRFGRRQLIHVLPADERNFAKWNRNPYMPDEGNGGKYEDDGASWLLAYWMGRYHGFITEGE